MPDYEVEDIEILRDMFRELNAERRKLGDEIESFGKKAEDEAETKLETMLEQIAVKVAKETALKRGVDAEDLMPFLGEEVERLTFFYKRQYARDFQRFLGKMAIFSRNVSMGTMTMGDIWHQMWTNIWSIIFGPWIVGSFFVFLQFLLISNYVPASPAKPFLQIMAPIIVGAGVFFLNFMSSKNPMDWLTHIVSGFLIAFTFAILWIGIFSSIESFPGGIIWFWIAWGASAFFIGTFSLYQLGGFRAVMQFAVIVLLFGYIALGPYKAEYRETIDKVKEPFTLAFRAIINAFKDAWILATNPTEWYARQQLRNMRSEQPLESPKGVEIVKIESLTPNVGIPSGEEFGIYATIQNQGKMGARNVEAEITCNEFCNIDTAKGGVTKLNRTNMKDLGYMEQDEQVQLRFEKIKAELIGKSAFEMAKITLSISYEYNTTSALPVTIALEAEIDRRLSSREDVFKPVVAKAMGGPAQISLNVGPQPLKASLEDSETKEKTSLLVAITNSRADGVIVLKKGVKLFIDVPEGLGNVHNAITGSKINDNEKICRANNVDCVPDGKNRIACTVNPDGIDRLEIKSADFSSILPIFCGFENIGEKQINVFKSEMITAEMQLYAYKTKKTLDITVTQPLGVAKASPADSSAPSSSPTTPAPSASPPPSPSSSPQLSPACNGADERCTSNSECCSGNCDDLTATCF